MSQFQKKTELEFVVSGDQHTRNIKCQLCGEPTRYLHMHHIIGRSHIPHNKIDELPLCFHVLLCEGCHIWGKMGFIDSPDMRAKLVSINARIYGWDKVEEGFRKLKDLLSNGIDDNLINIKKVKKFYDESTDS